MKAEAGIWPTPQLMGSCLGLGRPLPSCAVQGLLGNPFEEGFPVTGLYCSTVVSLYSNSYVHR